MSVKVLELKLWLSEQVWEIQTYIALINVKNVQACFKLVNQFLSKSLIIQTPTKEKDSLDIHDVCSFLNLWLFGILWMLN